MKLRCVLGLLMLGLAGCDASTGSAPPASENAASTTGAQIAAGTWRAVVELPGGNMPFTMDVLDEQAEGVKAFIINGEERVPVNYLTQDGSRVLIDFPAFNNRLVMTLDGDRMTGSLTLTKRHGKLQVMPVTMTAGQVHRFFEQPRVANADFGGRWRVEFVDDEGEKSIAVADFVQSGSGVTGTFRTPTGDYRFLDGAVEDRTLYLSTFDGAHAFLFDATMSDDGRLSGNFWSGTEWHETWTAVRDDNAALPDANDMTRMNDSTQAFVVEFPNVDGTLVRSNDARFQDKVLIVALAGSWCPNCHDEAAFLAPFYQAYRDQGLEVLGLMYEHLDDFSEAAAQVDRFRDKFGIEYELLVAGSSDKSKASETLPMLNRVIAYPTMIVIDRKGEVRRVHTGFNGPGTGDKYTEFRREFTAFIEQLLAEEQS